jgi:hypothetical protein
MGSQGQRRSAGVLCLLALLLAGCSSGNGGNTPPPQGIDPLLNGPPTPKDTATAKGGPDKPLPAVPAVDGPTTPAGVAGSSSPRSNGAGDLRIPNNQPTPADWKDPSSPVKLSSPVTEGSASRTQQIRTVGATSATETTDEYFHQLQSRGVKGIRLEQLPTTGQWRCVCSIPAKSDPTTKQNFEALRDDPVAVLRAVLDQIDHTPH